MYATEATAANAMVCSANFSTPGYYILLHSQAYIQLDRIEGKNKKILLRGEVNSTRSEKKTEIKKAKNRQN